MQLQGQAQVLADLGMAICSSLLWTGGFIVRPDHEVNLDEGVERQPRNTDAGAPRHTPRSKVGGVYSIHGGVVGEIQQVDAGETRCGRGKCPGR